MHWSDILIRLVIAIAIGGLIGYEREFKNRPAGFRTHILVCVGAAVASMIELSNAAALISNPMYEATAKVEFGRLGAQVITGVGFLGAGTILHEKGSITGLTTAASVWAVACVGLAVGMGYYFLSIAAAVSIYIILVTLKKFEDKFIGKWKSVKLEIEYGNRKAFVQSMEEYFDKKSIKIKNIEFTEDEEESEYYTSLYTLLIPKHLRVGDVVQGLGSCEEVFKVTMIK